MSMPLGRDNENLLGRLPLGWCHLEAHQTVPLSLIVAELSLQYHEREKHLEQVRAKRLVLPEELNRDCGL